MTNQQRDDARNPVQAMMASDRFAQVVAELAVSTGRDEADVRSDARTCLEEMAAQVSPQATQAWDRLGRWLTRSYTVDADTAGLPALRELGRTHSLVFLPNHRSYLDPLVLRNALQRHGFPPNHILGGINLAMWPMSELGRRSGLIFIRRTTRDDPVYPAMMRLYFGHLLRQHSNLEWYFEGGRTRTGKLRPPKMGVLRYLVDAFVANGSAADDVLVVPVAIVYDQQHEVEALSFEECGGAKTPESLELAGAASPGRSPVGAAGCTCGSGRRCRCARRWTRRPSGPARPTRPRSCPASPSRSPTGSTPPRRSRRRRWSTFGLLDNDGRAMTLAETLRLLDPLLAYVRAPSAAADLRRRPGPSRGPAAGAADPGQRGRGGGVRRRARSRSTRSPRDRQHEAGFYRNTVTHYFITRAIVEVAAVQSQARPRTRT